MEYCGATRQEIKPAVEAGGKTKTEDIFSLKPSEGTHVS
jgi:hypothetical protein